MTESENAGPSRAEQAVRVWSWVCVGLLLALSLKDQLRLEGSRMWWHWDRWNKRREWDQAFRKACNTMLFEAFTVLDEANRKP